MDDFKLGDRVKVLGKNAKGEIAYIGDTHFSDGTWLGIILDDAKGRHNGSVDGTRYFKCPRNHGVFVRVCQIEKEYAHNNDVNDKHHSSVSGKITYPNYLKSSNKLKTEKALKGIVTPKTKPHFKNADQQPVLEEDRSPKDRSDKSSKQVQLLKQENEQLKNKLKTIEQSLQETVNKYAKAMEEIKHLKEEIDCKMKQIKIQKCHLKLLKMRQGSYFKKPDAFSIHTKNSHQNRKGESSGTKSDLADNDANISDDEFDLESLKAMTSMQRIIDLEEQNRIMIQGLVELREFLKSKCQSQHTDLDSAGVKMNRRPLSRNDNTNSFSELLSDTPMVSADDSSLQLKEYTEMLQEMTKFNEIIKGKRKLGKESESQNLKLEPSGDFIPLQNDYLSDCNSNKALEFKKIYSNPLKYSGNSKSFFETTSAHANSETQNPWISNSNNFQHFFQPPDNQSSQKVSKLTAKVKEKSHMQYVDDAMSPKSGSPMNDLRQLMSAMVSNTGLNSCRSNASLIQQDLLVEEVAESTSSSAKSSEFQLALPCRSMEVAVNSSGDNALILSKDKKPKRRMLVSTRIYQTQDEGNTHQS